MDEPLDLELIEARVLEGSRAAESMPQMQRDAVALLAEVKRLRAAMYRFVTESEHLDNCRCYLSLHRARGGVR